MQRGCQTSCLDELSSFLGLLVGDEVFKWWLSSLWYEIGGLHL